MKRRKGLAFILALSLVLSSFSVAFATDVAEETTPVTETTTEAVAPVATATNTAFADIAGHWAKDAIVKWADYGVVKGSDGVFRPDAPLTRAEMATVLSNLMDYKVAAKNNFSDVATGAWYADAVLKANAAGVLSGDGSGLASPSANITREQATSMLARAFAVADANGTSSSLTDTQNISSWARPAVFGMEAAGYVRGFEGKFNPKNNITRAEVITIINSAVKAYYTAAGTYTENVDGLAVVKVPGVVLKDVVISGNLIAAEGIASGDLTLDGKTEVKGKLIVRGGGENSIIIKGSAAVLSIEVSKVDGKVRIFADGALIKEITALKGEIILEGNFTNVEVKADATVIIKGNVVTLSMESKGTVDIQSGTVTTLDIPAGATATVAANATVTTANITGAADIKGTGAIGTANISGTGATIVQTPTAVNVADGGAATVGGKTVDGATSAAPSTGGGRGNSSNTVAVSAININKSTTTLVEGTTETLTVTFTPSNASNKTITWTTSDASKATIDSTGKVRAVSAGTATITAKSNNGKTATCVVTVTTTVVPVSAITVNPTTMDLTVGGASKTIVATVKPADATNKSVTWATSNNAVATVVNGVVTPKTAGTATITATTVDGGFSKTILVTVNPVTPPAYASTNALANATVSVANGTSEADAKAALDATVGVVGTNSETGSATIVWTITSYNGTTAGNYTATGVLTLPSGWTGSPGTVTATVTVNPPVTPIAYASTKKLTNATVTVDNGTSEADAKAALDKTVGVVGTKGETDTANIAWTIASYDGNALGEYPATGVLTLPTGWTGTAGNVTATVRVTKANVPSSITLGSSILNSTNPYLVDGKPATTGMLGADKCTARFDSLTGVLSLQDYVGGKIHINEAGKDLRIKLIGNNNKITGGQFGIHNDKGDIYITSDNEASLEIEINSSYDGAAIANGWMTMTENPSVFIGGKAKVTVKAKYTGEKTTNSITGIYAGRGSVIIQDQADYSATITNSNYQGRGIYSNGKTIINTSGKIEIDVSNSDQGVGIYGNSGIEIQQVNSMLITIPSTGEVGNTKFTSGTVDVSLGVAVNKSTTKASYRSGTPYTLGLEGGNITSATGGVIGSPHQYLVDDEITIESTISEFDRWTKANGAALETSLFTGDATANSATATIKMPAGSLSIKAREKETGTVIDIAAIPGVVAPVKGATPVTTITVTEQYTGTVTWSPTATKFAGDTAYIATITLEAKPGFKLDGVAANFFTVEGATVTNEADTGEIIAVFPATEADTLIDIAEILGVEAPVTGKTPVTKINDTEQYTGTVAWTPADNPFAAEKVYTATIKLTAKPGFKLDGVAANFFTVEGATTTNTADSGVVKAVFPATAASDFAAGSGIAGDPYQVSNAEQLNKVRNYPGSKVYFKQTEDIDLTAYLASGGAGYNEGKGWVPIGSSESPFTGNYDGSVYTITGLTIESTEDYQGLFGCVKQYTNLKNIELLGVNIKGKSYVGGLIGNFGFGQLENCHVSGKVEGTEDFVGGLAGLYNNSNVGEGMKNCSTSVEVIGNNYVGGLAGKSGWTTIDSCYSEGSVTGVDIVGGLVGSVASTTNVKVTNSYSLASVTATTGRVGGLVGLNWKAIENCYAAGQVTGNVTNAGGLVGENKGTINSSYYDSIITKQSDEGKGVGKTTAEMMKKTTFSGWDFETIWTIVEDSSYPTLQ